MRIVCVSDTHSYHDRTVVPDGDILIHAGDITRHGDLEDVESFDRWLGTLRHRYKLVICGNHAIRAAVPHMKQAGSGRIVTVSSTAGQRGEAGHAHYAATKGAVISLTKSLAGELAPFGITVNCVAPGWVDTDMTREDLEGPRGDAIRATIPLGRAGRPEEIAGAVAFLASDLASYVTGEILNVNGGSVLCG